MTVRVPHVLAGCAVWLLACGGDTGVASPDAGANAEPDISADAVVDVAPDTVQVIDTGTDIPDADTDSDGSAGADAGASAGEPCEQVSDCEAPLLCVDLVAGEGGTTCVEPCNLDDDCPRGFDCVVVSTGADSVSICVDPELCIDQDEDGFGQGPGCLGRDCNDDDPLVNPRAPERCNGFDDDCDELVDNSPVDTGSSCTTSFQGACLAGQLRCVSGVAECTPIQVPTPERCNAVDDDCDGVIDEDDAGAPLRRECFDGSPEQRDVGVCRAGFSLCVDGIYGSCGGQVAPSPERCNELDDDCDAETDEDLVESTFWPDVDGDGFGEAGSEAVVACGRPVGYADNRRDCNDADETINPDAVEQPGDETDQNCDQLELCFADTDRDGFHAGVVLVSANLSCADPGESGDPDADGDCNDLNNTIFPGSAEVVGDGIDQNCDGRELCLMDEDNDGVGVAATVESPDTDCNDEGELPAGAATNDCDDTDDRRAPTLAEVCDNLDNDCDTQVDEGVGCLPVGEPCSEGADCETQYCEDGFCAVPTTCDLASCPSRFAPTSASGLRRGPNYAVELHVGVPLQTNALTGPRYRVQFGVGAFVREP